MVVVKLSRIVDGLGGSILDDWFFYLDRNTGESMELQCNIIELLDIFKDILQEEGMTVESARDKILEDEDCYYHGDLSIEDELDIAIRLLGHELLLIDPLTSHAKYIWMEEYIDTLSDERDQQLLSIAIDGKGAFRRFKDVADTLGKLQDYFHFKDKRLFEAARKWCEDNAVEYHDDWEIVEKLRYLDKGFIPA